MVQLRKSAKFCKTVRAGVTVLSVIGQIPWLKEVNILVNSPLHKQNGKEGMRLVIIDFIMKSCGFIVKSCL